MSPVPDALILCGGAGRRLGGVDKPLQPLAGRPLIERVLMRVAPQAGQLIIVANRHAADYAGYGVRVIDDGAQAGTGPLGGIVAGLAAATSDDVLIVPGDAPLLPDDLRARLDDARRGGGKPIACVDDGTGLQPLCALLDRRLHGALAALWAGGERSVRAAFERLGLATAAFPDWPHWVWSLNTPEQWQDAAARLADTLEMPE